MRRSIGIVFLLITFSLQAGHRLYNLQAALDKKLVIAKVTSQGGFQGFCVQIELKNLTKDSLLVIIEPGRRLNSLDDTYQDLLIVKQQVVGLRGNDKKTVKVKSYCCQVSRAVPMQGSAYEINKLADSNLVAIARYLNTRTIEAPVEQQAIWAVSDHEPIASITSHNDSVTTALRELVARIENKPLPWYTVISTTYIYSNGAIQIFPLWLKGKLDYSAQADSYITLRIVDQKGLPVGMTKSEWHKASGNGQYDLNVPVKGLSKGKYTVELLAEGQSLVKKEFEI